MQVWLVDVGAAVAGWPYGFGFGKWFTPWSICFECRLRGADGLGWFKRDLVTGALEGLGVEVDDGGFASSSFDSVFDGGE